MDKLCDIAEELMDDFHTKQERAKDETASVRVWNLDRYMSGYLSTNDDCWNNNRQVYYMNPGRVTFSTSSNIPEYRW